VYALEDDGDEVMVFDDFAEMVEKLKPSVVVADAFRGSSYLFSRTCENGITFLKLKDPKTLG
jgi:SpoU rRNA methylase family enzyme